MKTHIFLLLLLAALVCNAQIPLSTSEAFDYQVGDTLVLNFIEHAEGLYPTSLGYCTYVVIQRTNTINQIDYRIQRNSHQTPSEAGGTLDTITQSYAVGGVIYCSLPPTVAPSYPLDTVWGEQVNGLDTTFCSDNIRTTKWVKHYSYSASGHEIYGAGLGLIESYYPSAYQDQWQMWHFNVNLIKLVYVHKVNGTVCGSRVYLGLKQALAPPKVTIYPNPTVGIFNLQVEEDNGQGLFSLFNTMGDKVIEEPIGQNLSQINCFGLSSGLYFWRLEIQGKPWANGKLVLQ